MAFELPDHLPRGGLPKDKPTRVLTKIGQATHTALNASLAASWLNELDVSIQATESQISQKIHNDIPTFERYLKSSTSIQARLSELCTTVDTLTDTLNNPKTGILPHLLETLTIHESLSAQTKDSNVLLCASTHLLDIRTCLCELSDKVQQGQLPESVQVCARLQGLITAAPDPLDRADIMDGIQKKYRTLRDRLQEQLNDAYSRSVRFSSADDNITLTILSSTSVPPTPTHISLSAIFCSLTPDSLSTRLSGFRRELMNKMVDQVLLSSRLVTVSESDYSNDVCLSFSPTSSTPLQSLRTLMDFLNSHIFPHLPPTQASFPTSLHVPITSAILTHLLTPSIPSSISALPSFLEVVDEAVYFEDTFLSGDIRDRSIRSWVDDVAGHYEKKRRESFLRQAREILIEPENGSTYMVEVPIEHPPDSFNHSVMAETGADARNDNDGVTRKLPDTFTSQTAKGQNGYHGNIHTATSDNQSDRKLPGDEEEASDGWGWGNDDDGDGSDADKNDEAGRIGPSQDKSHQAEVQNSDLDDAWDDDGWSTDPPPPPSDGPETDRGRSGSLSKVVPKMATRLEKFSAKSKGLASPNLPADMPSVAPQVTQQLLSPSTPSHPPQKKPVDRERYLVSSRARRVLEIAENVVREGHDLLNSHVFAAHSSTTTVPGQLLIAAAPSILDLHRAVYPIAHSSSLARDLNLAMLWSNDCKFLSDEVVKLGHRRGLPTTEERWPETADRLKALGELCYDDAVRLQQEAVRNILVGAQHFGEVSISEQFDECKSAMARVLQEITSVARQWKQTLTQSRYVQAVGQVVDDALFQVMDDILALEDIPEADSERLSELCEVLGPLEEVFVLVPGEQSVVGSYVPLWYKFSYLSWLIKGSIADISYLFDQGMLVDYEIDELVRLVRALFAETPLRQNTIAKLSQGHPLLPDDRHQ